PMAGHPTVGTSFVLAREHLVRRDAEETTITLEERVGPVPVRIEFKDGEPAFAEMSQPLPTFGPPLSDARAIAGMLSLDARHLGRYGLVARDGAAEIVSEQGIEMGRPSFIKIRIERDGDRITAVKVGGQCHFMGEGFIEI